MLRAQLGSARFVYTDEAGALKKAGIEFGRHAERHMDRLVITIHPTPSDEGLLRVADAMQQVVDALRVIEQAERALVPPQELFEWRLERASTASPFTVVAVAESVDPTVNVTPHVMRVKTEVSRGLREFIVRGTPPRWMDAEGMLAFRRVLSRNQNGVGRTDIDFEMAGNETDLVWIDRAQAAAGIRAIAALNIMDLEDLPERESFGEIEGVMVAAGRYRGRPAVQIRTELYGFVWCVLSHGVIERFGNEHRMADVWEGRTVGVHGRLTYAVGGKLSRVEVIDMREILAAPPIDLDSVLDPNFTGGMDPHEYLRQLHDGELA